MIRKVLLPLDFCRDFQDYVRYGMEFAASMTAELYLLHVARSSRRSHQPRWSAECDVDDDTRRFVSQAVIRRGSPAETIARYANSIDADLILMPTRGRGLMAQLLFGSTTMDVLRMANRPLWVAKPQSITAEKPVRCKRILCGVELGSQGESVLRYASRLARACGGELLIVHAVPEISEAMLMVYGLDDSGEIELLPKAAHRRLTSMTATIDVPYQVEARIGDVAAILRKFAKLWRADVVVVGRGRRTGLWQLGANIGDIIARSPTPVITDPGSCRRIRAAGLGIIRSVAPVHPVLGRATLSVSGSEGR
jgi:nucleotide-binding universal stress UspA family protein